MHIHRHITVRLLLFTLIALLLVGGFSFTRLSSAKATTANIGKYHVYNGFLSGNLTGPTSLDQFRSKDTQLLFNPAGISLSINAPEYFIVQGVQQSNHWSYSYQIKPDIGKGILTIAVAINAANHTKLIVTGVPTQRELNGIHVQVPAPASVQPGCPSLSSRKMSSSSLNVLPASGCYLKTRYVTQITYWYDPVGIRVNEVDTQLVCSEYFNPSNVSCSANYATYWYTGSGWYQVSRSLRWYYGTGNAWAEADGYAHFRNTSFPLCTGGTVDTNYSPNWAYIPANDNYSGGSSTWNTGPACINLLRESTWTQVG